MKNHIKIVSVIRNTLSYVDPRLMNHGDSVAYLVYQILKSKSEYTEDELRNICLLAILHDIGAYETENIDKLVQFETESVWEHSIYGYLVLKYFSPFQELAPVVLYHHASLAEMKNATEKQKELAQIFHIADRLDIARYNKQSEDDFRNFLNKERERLFESKIVDYMLKSDFLTSIFSSSYSDNADYTELMYNTNWTNAEIASFVKLIVFSIDFRSPQTVAHTIATTSIATSLGRYLKLSENEIKVIQYASWLHDIGKIGIPVEILEKSGRLSDREFSIMREHIILSDNILKGNVDDEVRLIAVRHHEKLNGLGYPLQLSAKDLTLSQRILAVADIFSALSGTRSYKEPYPKSKVTSLLLDMGTKGQLDAHIIDTAVSHYNDLLKEVSVNTKPVIDNYKAIYEEQMKLRNEYAAGDDRESSDIAILSFVP